jgi:hypothetical protein
MFKTIIITLAIVVTLLLLIIYLLIKAFGSAADSLFGGLSRGAISSSITIEKKARYQKSFIARLFHRHKWEPKLDSTLHYSKTQKICYICGATK